MAKCEPRFGFGGTSWVRHAWVLGALLQACADDDAAPTPQTSPLPAMSSAVAAGRGTQGSAGRRAAAPTPPPRPAGASAAEPTGSASPPRAGRSGLPKAGASGSASAGKGMAGESAVGGAVAAAGARGAAPTGTLGGKLMFTGELTNGTVIPQKYKCSMPRFGGNPGENVSPPLAWTGGPATTQSYALIVYDITYSQFHWAVWDIPVTANALPEGVPTGYDLAEPAGAHQFNGIARATDEHMYYGPCSGGAMAGTYEFRLFALDKATLGLTETSNAQAIQRAVDEAELDKVVWAGMPD